MLAKRARQGAEGARRAPGRRDRRRHLAVRSRDADPDDHALAVTAGRLYERERAAVARGARAAFPAVWAAVGEAKTDGVAELNTVRPARRAAVVWRPTGRTASRSCWCTGPGTTTGRCPRASSTPASTELAARGAGGRRGDRRAGVPQARLPSIRYLTGAPGVEKIVDFWSMRPWRGSDRPADDEIEEARWVPAVQAPGAAELRARPGCGGGVPGPAAGDRGRWCWCATPRPASARNGPAPDDDPPAGRRRRARRGGAERPPAASAARVGGVGRPRCAAGRRWGRWALPLRPGRRLRRGAADRRRAADALRGVAARGGASVVCSQGKLMPPLLAALTGRTNVDFHTRKGSGCDPRLQR